jgi:hypothetical protein
VKRRKRRQNAVDGVLADPVEHELEKKKKERDERSMVCG